MSQAGKVTLNNRTFFNNTRKHGGIYNVGSLQRATDSWPGVPTDQRGLPNTNTTCTGCSTASTYVDLGAVQTNYHSVQFTNPPAADYEMGIVNKDVRLSSRPSV
jgi:hypothetical protein